MLPAFFVLAAMRFAELSFAAALLVGFAASVLVLGVLFKRLVVDPILRHGVLPLVISTLGLAILFKEGVKEFCVRGPLGFPVVDVAVTLTDGQYHSVDSSDMAFKTAGRMAMTEGMPKCDPVLLEPEIGQVGAVEAEDR